MAWVGQPLRDVAIQAGQFILYGCGKGECGTCECLVDGKWVRPCSTTVPLKLDGEAAVIQVKKVHYQNQVSARFFSLRSFVEGFWNNLLGMVGFVQFHRAAKENWEERKAYEEMITKRTQEKRALRETKGTRKGRNES